jgi:CBS domain containing-hemolysin-like protein
MVRHNLVIVLGRIVAIAVLLLLNGFFVAVEFALVRSRRTRLEAMARGGDRLARLSLHGIAHIGRMLSASQLGITLSSLGLGALTEETLAEVFAEWLHALPITVQFLLRGSSCSLVGIFLL